MKMDSTSTDTFGTALVESGLAPSLGLRANGFEISDLGHADMIVMLQEAGHEYEPSIAEQLGFVR